MAKFVHFLIGLIFCAANCGAQDSLVQVIDTVKKEMLDTATLSSQGLFEGKVTYQIRELNPNPQLISDDEFYESLPNNGIRIMEFYIRGNKYRIEHPDRIEVYGSAGAMVQTMSKRTKDSIGLLSAQTLEDQVVKNQKISQTQTILGYPCSGMEIETKWEKRTYYVHPTQLKTNPSFWRNHQREFYHLSVAKTGNFPLLMIQKSMLGNQEIRAIKIEKMTLTDDLFQLSSSN